MVRTLDRRSDKDYYSVSRLRWHVRCKCGWQGYRQVDVMVDLGQVNLVHQLLHDNPLRGSESLPECCKCSEKVVYTCPVGTM